MRLLAFVILALAFVLSACSLGEVWSAPASSDPDASASGAEVPDAGPPGDPPDPVPTELDYFAGLAAGDAQRAALCARGNQDRFASFYCAEPAPAIGGLEDIQVGMGLVDPATPDQTRFAMLSHSMALLTRGTTVLDPSAIVYTTAPDYAAVAFKRGDGLAEIVARDTARDDLNFYLVHYQKPCGDDCSTAELYLPSNESGWTAVDVYGDPDLQNTVLDCLQCHQPAGAGTQRILRMQELPRPWTHWFRDDTATRSQADLFMAAHAGETYGGIPVDQVLDGNGDPRDFQSFVEDAGFDDQINEYDGFTINGDDDVATPNAAWLALYDRALAGQAISPPYFGVSPFDPARVSAASDSYRAAAQGAAAPETTPDLTDLFLDSARPYLGYTAGAGLDATGIVLHRCGTCHDGRFPGFSKDNFHAADFPDGLDAAMKNLVIARITQPRTSRFLMPPVIHSDLTPEQIAAIREALGL